MEGLKLNSVQQLKVINGEADWLNGKIVTVIEENGRKNIYDLDKFEQVHIYGNIRVENLKLTSVRLEKEEREHYKKIVKQLQKIAKLNEEKAKIEREIMNFRKEGSQLAESYIEEKSQSKELNVKTLEGLKRFKNNYSAIRFLETAKDIIIEIEVHASGDSYIMYSFMEREYDGSARIFDYKRAKQATKMVINQSVFNACKRKIGVDIVEKSNTVDLGDKDKMCVDTVFHITLPKKSTRTNAELFEIISEIYSELYGNADIVVIDKY